MTRRLLVAVPLLLAVLPAPALAYWRTGGSGTAGATAGTLSAPTVTAPATAGTSVALSWAASRLSPANAALVASSSSSGTPLSQCSANGVQPMPTMATRSLMPCEPMSPPSTAAVRLRQTYFI